MESLRFGRSCVCLSVDVRNVRQWMPVLRVCCYMFHTSIIRRQEGAIGSPRQLSKFLHNIIILVPATILPVIMILS
jgi:hypothetical protein